MPRTSRRPRRARARLALLGAFAVPLPAAAQVALTPPPAGEPTAVLPELTVTGTRAVRPIEQVPQTVQVIERDEIERQIILSPSPSEAITGWCRATRPPPRRSRTLRRTSAAAAPWCWSTACR